MARAPKGNDRAQILAVAAGEADIAVANTYYLASDVIRKKVKNKKQQQKKYYLSFQIKDRGTHMNISGAGILKGRSK